MTKIENKIKGMVSVIIPVYNTEKYLKYILDSVINQTYKNLEIICVNDGSTDNSLNILNQYAKNDKRIIVIDKENCGVSAARNSGMDIAKGEYIGFLDSDDYIDLNYFKILVDVIVNDGTDIAVCEMYDTTSFDENNNIFKDNNIKVKSKIFKGKNFSGRISRVVYSRIYKHSLIENIRFNTEINIGEDTVFIKNVTFLSDDVKISYIKEKMYFYYHRINSAFSNANNYSYFYCRCKGFSDLYYETDSEQIKVMCITEIIKDYIGTSHVCSSLPDFESNHNEMKKVIDEFLSLMKKDKNFPTLRKIKYRLLVKMPVIFRIYYKLLKLKK